MDHQWSARSINKNLALVLSSADASTMPGHHHRDRWPAVRCRSLREVPVSGVHRRSLRLVDVARTIVGHVPQARTTGRRPGSSGALIALGVSALLLATSGTAFAADPRDSGMNVEFGPAATDGDVTIQSVFCGATAVTVKVNASTVGSQGFQTCSGTVLVQKISVFLEVCDIDFIICFHWQTIRTYASCSRLGAGSLSCPAAGTYNARPGPGKYRTRTEGSVTDASGGGTYTGVGWGAEVILTS